MQAECLRSQIAPLAARYRSCSSSRQRTSAAQCQGCQFAPLAARCRSCSSSRQRTSAAQCSGSQFAPRAARCRSCSSSRQRTCAGVAPQAIRAKGRRLNAASVQTASARPRPSAWALNSRPWQFAIARAHRTASARARGLHPWQFAARGRAGQFAPWSGELRSRLCKPPAHVRAGGCAWNFLRPRTLYFTGPALDFCEFSLNFPCIFGKIGIRKQPLSQIF